MNWPAYPEYKDSGIEWLDEVPDHWPVSRFSRHITINGGQVDPRKSPYDEMPLIAPNHVESGTGKLLALESATEQGADSGKYLVRAGQIIYSKIRPNLSKVVIAPVDCMCSADMYGLSPDPNLLDPNFLLYLFLSDPFTRYVIDSSMRVAMPKVNHDSLGAAPIWYPPLHDQLGIVAFLDRETGKIDALIDKQNQLIATLREDRTATITHAVTKGLNPDAEMKDSGIGWIGDTPTGWAIGKVKHGFSVTLGKMYQGESRNPGDVLLPHLKAGSLTRQGLDTSNPMECWFTPFEVSSLYLRRNDVLIVEGGSIGRCAVLAQDMPGWGFQKSLNRARAINDDSPHFLAYLIEAAAESGHISILCGKSTIPHFTSEKVGALEWPHPSPVEQRKIVDHLDLECTRIDGLIAKAADVVTSLSEYRSALITAAVTGKIDVRGAA